MAWEGNLDKLHYQAAKKKKARANAKAAAGPTATTPGEGGGIRLTTSDEGGGPSFRSERMSLPRQWIVPIDHDGQAQ